MSRDLIIDILLRNDPPIGPTPTRDEATAIVDRVMAEVCVQYQRLSRRQVAALARLVDAARVYGAAVSETAERALHDAAQAASRALPRGAIVFADVKKDTTA